MRSDYRAGDLLEPLKLVVDGPSMKVFSVLMRDPNPIHFDPAFVESLGLGDRTVNQGTISMAYPINALLRLVDDPGQLVRFRCRFQGNLVTGDIVTVTGAVTSVDDELVGFDLWVDREDGMRALTCSAELRR